MLKDCCSVCNFTDDGFIGIKFQDGLPHVSFPRGYTLSEDDDAVRKDILGLVAVLQRFSGQREGDSRNSNEEEYISFPFLSYQHVIYDFLAHGYYREREVEHRISDHGKINWKRTIQQVRPQVDHGNVVYLNFVTKRSINKTNLLTQIHEFCVFESFSKLVQYIRCYEAEHLLLTTDMKIQEISDRCGFSSVKYFHKYFKLLWRITPLQHKFRHLRFCSEPDNFFEYEKNTAFTTVRDHIAKRHIDKFIEI